MNGFVISSFLAVTVGFIANMYDGVAIRYGWPMGKLFTQHKKWVVTIGWLCIISGAIELFTDLKFIKGIFAFIIAIVFAVMLIRIFKSNIQWISAIILLASVIIWIITGAEVVHVQ